MNEDFRRPATNTPARPFDPATTAANYTINTHMTRPAAQVPMMPYIPRQSPIPPPLATRTVEQPRPMLRQVFIPNEEIRVPSRSRRQPQARSRERLRAEKSEADGSPGSSVLAGLAVKGSGGSSGRVKAWRAHVEPGAIPDEEPLSCGP